MALREERAPRTILFKRSSVLAVSNLTFLMAQSTTSASITALLQISRSNSSTLTKLDRSSLFKKPFGLPFQICSWAPTTNCRFLPTLPTGLIRAHPLQPQICLLYTSDAADERSSVDLGGRRIIKK